MRSLLFPPARQPLMVPLCLVALLLLAAPARGEMNTGQISGIVRDASGAVIVGATVSAEQPATHLRYVSVTNTFGEYLLAQLPVAAYTLSIDSQGFKQAIQSNIMVHAGNQLRQDFTLEVGGKIQTVTVQATPTLLQLQSAQIKNVVGNAQVVTLPLESRQFLELSLLSAGVVSPPGGTRGDALEQAGTLVNILGQRSGHNLYLVDGTNATDEYFNNLALSPSIDDIQEVSIKKTDYDAEFGGKSGAVINVITKSGTNQFHGDLFEFVRNNAFDARNFFDAANQPVPPLHQNQFGGTLGGPVLLPKVYNGRNKTFFFLSYEGQRQRNSLTQEFNVPTLAEASGNFAGVATILRDPITQQPIPGNNLNNDPNIHLDPAASALLAKLPPPNLPGTGLNLLAVGDQRIDTNIYSARVDHQFSSADSAFVRALVFHADEFDPFGAGELHETLLPGFGRNLDTHSFSLALSETHTFTPDIVNEFRFGWLTVDGGQSSPNAGIPFASQYGIQGTTTNLPDMGYPQVALNNEFTTLGDPSSFVSRSDRNFEFYDNILVHHGRHTIKFGGYFFHLDFNPVNPDGARGIFQFAGEWTGNPLADFLAGYPASAQVGLGEGAEHAHTNWAHFYIDDRWQATPRLDIDAGLRYELNTNLVDSENQISNIDLSAPGGQFVAASNGQGQISPAANALLPLSPIPVVPSSKVGWNNSLLTPRYLRFSPRFGLAWHIPYTHGTVVRAGFGVYTNQASYSILQNLAENLPFFLLKTVTNPPQSGSPTYTTEDILTSNTLGTIGANGVNHNYRIEYNEVWNATVERAITANMTAEVQYVGSKTVHADDSIDPNMPVPGSGAALRPYAALGAFNSIRWDGWANFQALTLQLTRRFSHGLSLDANYTWSKSIDDASDTGTTNNEYNLPQNPYNLAAEKGLSSFDHPNRFVANAIYNLPFARGTHGWLRAVLGGWQASGILTLQSGAPFTVNLPTSFNSGDLVNGVNLARPNLVADPNNGPKSPQEWFNTSAFALPAASPETAPYIFGNAGRNVVWGPGLQDFDVSLQKMISLREGINLQFRAEAYNALNHPNFDIPNRIFGSATFGQISSAQNARQLQFALKLLF
ncbi:MAG: carboxypeptidase regulatory-like domain-containing protein [Terriglobia bacterium]